MYKKPLIILTGPTAVGKTSLSIETAKMLNGEIISADSMQVYKYMNIGTAKITCDEMCGIKHYLIDEFEPSEEFNIVKFKEYSKKYMEEIYLKGKIPIIVGGTGFYIQALLYDIEFENTTADIKYRKELEKIAKEKGNKYLHKKLSEIDEKSAAKIHFNNVKRVIRALEYYKETNRPISEHNEEQQKRKSPYNFIYFVLNDKREDLYKRIDERVDIMFKNGLLNEVETLKNMGYTKNYVSMQGLGYKEILDYFDGIYSLAETVDIIKKETRHFAKRQLTWFRREKEVEFLNIYEYKNKQEILEFIKNKCIERGIIC